MNNLDNIQQLMAQEVSRRQFLLHTGTALLAIFGISGLIRNLNSIFPQKNNESGAYGWSGYSGLAGKKNSLQKAGKL